MLCREQRLHKSYCTIIEAQRRRSSGGVIRCVSRAAGRTIAGELKQGVRCEVSINPHTRHLIRHTLGWGLLVMGIAGVLLPFLHGLTFLLVGIWLLAVTSAYSLIT